MKKYIVANLKMNKNFDQFENYLENLNLQKNNNEIIICPSNIFLEKIYKRDLPISIGAQDVDHRVEGAATGSTSAAQIKNICDYTLVGHSERRETFSENNFMIGEKLLRCWENSITPILCVGENLEIRKSGIKNVENHLYSQITQSLNDNSNFEKLIIAYEPIWAIGTGLSASIKEVSEVSEILKNKLLEISNIEISILYGGSVNLSNYKELLAISSISGLLIGSASLDPKVFSEISNNS
ncbi:MAG: triose-phosphate isomerase [Dehalococcoidia bacterium]|nr:triose-phosphate isomerase [Dehalococcoidia bacterium]